MKNGQKCQCLHAQSVETYKGQPTAVIAAKGAFRGESEGPNTNSHHIFRVLFVKINDDKGV